MNGPSINNIDQWLFEAAEGNLSASQEALLDAFLLDNPAFVDEKEMWTEAKVVADAPVYSNINSLIKQPVWTRPAVYIPAAAVLLFGAVYGLTKLDGSAQQDQSEKDQSFAVNAISTDEQSVNTDESKVGLDVATQENEEVNSTVHFDPTNAENDKNQLVVDSKDGGEVTQLNRNVVAVAKGLDREESAISGSENPSKNEPSTNSDKLTSNSKDAKSIKSTSTFATKDNTDKVENKVKAVQPVPSSIEQDLAEQPETIHEEPIYRATIVNDQAISKEQSNEPIAEVAPETKSSSDVEPKGINNSSNNNSSNNNLTDSETEENQKAIPTNKPLAEAITESLELDQLSEVLNPAKSEASISGPVLSPKYDQTRIASNYDASFKSVMRSSMRKLVRMMDNPLALKNAKDMVYHVPNMQTLDVNFSSVGSVLVPRMQMVSRAQYLGRSNEQFMNQLAFDTYVRSLRGGIGVQLMNNYYGQGAYNTSQIALAYSPKIGVSKHVVIEPGMRVKFGNTLVNDKKLNPSQLVEVNRMNVQPFFDENTSSIGSSLWYQDVGVSLMTNTKWFTAGVHIDNLGRHYENVYNNLNPLGRRAPLHFTAMLGTDYMSRNKNISFSPYAFYQKMENLSEIWAGSIFRLKKFTIGGAYSSLGDYAGSIGFKTNLVMLTYSADYTTSAVFNTRLLSHQLSLRILFNSGPFSQRMLKLK